MLTEEQKEYKRQYYHANKDRLKESTDFRRAEWNRKNRERKRDLSNKSYHLRKSDPKNIVHYLLKHAKARAVKKNLDYNLVPEDIILPEVCPILGIPFNKDITRYTYSIDRLDPTKGYTKDNIWIISHIANAMKWNSTHEERVLFAKWVLSLEGG